MKVSIQTVAGKKHVLEDVSPEATVAQVKDQIEQQLHLGEAAGMKLIFSGKLLKDTQTMADAKVKDGDFMVAMVSAKKAAPTPAAGAAPAPTPAPVPTPAAPTPAAPAPAQPAAQPSAGSSGLASGAAFEEAVAQLMGLGFEQDQVHRCMRAAFNNVERAAEYLFNGIPAGVEAAGGGGAPGPRAGGPPPPPAPPGVGGDFGMEDEEGDEEGGEMPDMAQLMQNPEAMQQMLQMVAQHNPELLPQIQANPAAFMQMMAAAMAQRGMGGMGGQGGGGGGPGPAGGGGGGGVMVQLTQEEKGAVDRLEALGFSRQQVLEAFLACDRVEELAANYLFDNR